MDVTWLIILFTTYPHFIRQFVEEIKQQQSSLKQTEEKKSSEASQISSFVKRIRRCLVKKESQMTKASKNRAHVTDLYFRNDTDQNVMDRNR